ncbi:MAG TPA: mechanosensitive ion channel, partial [Trueperaceae bacterium]|nr:mechanosensitive ion channel [Trueperaceae bacterium]
KFKRKPKERKRYTLLVWLVAALIALIVLLSFGSADLVGILVTAGIAISSTTFIANAMAGIMLSFMHDFEIGDAIKVDDNFGLVMSKGPFHIQIQTEDSDIIVLPNLQLINNPVTVMRSSGTIISAQLSLGYEINRKLIKEILLEAAQASDLENPFVQILELGDFSVTYRVGGLLKDVSSFISARSELREEILDSLHKAKIEIVSPTFMNTRSVGNKTFIPKNVRKKEQESELKPEDVVFSDVKKAQEIEDLQEEANLLEEKINEKKKHLQKAEKENIGLNLDNLKEEIGEMEQTLEEMLARLEPNEEDS